MNTSERVSPVFPFNSGHVDVMGYKIHYVEYGEGSPVLFIHGNPTSSYLWRNVLPHVASQTGRRGIALDLLGFGKSDKPDDVKYTLKFHADILRSFIAALGLKNIVMVADDWGGPLGMDAVVKAPELFDGIVLSPFPPSREAQAVNRSQ